MGVKGLDTEFYLFDIFSVGEPGRSASIPVGLQSKARQKISSSNPQLNATLADEQTDSHRSAKWIDEDDEQVICEGLNMPGNRSSMAEARPGALNVPGLGHSSSGSRKVMDEHGVYNLQNR